MYETILRLIRDGFWGIGDKIYSERQLAEQYGVSRLTVRRAISDLLAGGYLEYREGRQGAFVVDQTAGKGSEAHSEGLIGVAVDNHTPEFATSLMQGIHNALWEEGLHTIYCNTYRENELLFPKIKALVTEHQVQGFILSPLLGTEYDRTNRKILSFLEEHDVPFVLVDRFIRDQLHDHVVINNRECFRELTRRLIAMGHSRILIPCGFEATSVEDRIAGVFDAFDEAGLDPAGVMTILCDEYRYELGRTLPAGTDTLGDFTAVIGMNSLYTRLGKDIARQLGKEVVVGSIAVNGHDSDSDLTIIHPVYDLGRESGKLLMRIIREKPLPVTHLILKARLQGGTL